MPLHPYGNRCRHRRYPGARGLDRSRLLANAEAHAVRYSTHRYLAKPFDLDALLTTIREKSRVA